ncbi:MAG: PAS domain S-box protein [Syntrophobacteraceae bacterium]
MLKVNDELETRVQELTAELEKTTEILRTEITQHNRSRETLAIERKRLFSLLNSLPAFVFLMARDYSIRYANDYFTEAFGKTKEMRCYEIPCRGDVSCSSCPALMVLNTKKPQYWERLNSSNGRTYQVYGIPFKDTNESQLVLVLGFDISDRKQAEQKLAESEDRYRQTAENIRGVLSMMDDRLTRMIYISRGYEEIYGRPCQSVYDDPLSWLQTIHPEDRERVKAEAKERLKGEYNTEYRIIRPDGSVRWIWDHAFPIFDQSGKVHRVVGIMQDITERKLMEGALRDSRELFEKTFNNQLDGILIVDSGPPIKILNCNQAAVKIFGYSREELLDPQAHSIHVNEESRESILRLVIPALKEQGFFYIPEYPMRKKDGTIFPTEQSVVQLQDEKGNPIGWVNVVRDITERVKTQEALRESEEMFRRVAEASTDFIIRYNREGRYVYVNQALTSFTGIPAEGFIGKTPRELGFDNDTSRKWDENIKEVFNTGESRQWDFEFDGAEGRIIFDVKAVPEFSEDGEIKIVMIVGRDITGRVQAEEVIRKSEGQLRFLSSKLLSVQEEEKRRIAGEIHDSLGSSLSAIKISLESIRTRTDEDMDLAQSLNTLISWTQHAIDEARRLITDLRPSILDDLGLLATLAWFLRQYRTTNPAIYVEDALSIEENDIPEPLKIVIFRIIQEAFHNISKYSEAELVGFSLAKTNRSIELKIEDNGVGFDLQTVLHSKIEGRGLGLTSMKERAELAGGTFSIESVPGEGTAICASWSLDG